MVMIMKGEFERSTYSLLLISGWVREACLIDTWVKCCWKINLASREKRAKMAPGKCWGVSSSWLNASLATLLNSKPCPDGNDLTGSFSVIFSMRFFWTIHRIHYLIGNFPGEKQRDCRYFRTVDGVMPSNDPWKKLPNEVDIAL